ncbi:oxygenase MpaB family protein [Gordonia sp. CPCC 205333]|uniref:oxygenase MpaB family protein n=1 Tax=Gordonia sp. CPCC 205333 TaxID=3140790 RepID=UPI003AF36995
MTRIMPGLENPSAAETSDPDVLVNDEIVGKNVYYAGTRVPERAGDDSLRPKERAQYPVPPNSLLWKYMGDPFLQAATGQRTAIVENMWPQLGQGVSDHSVVVSSKDFDVLTQRARSSQMTINGILFAPPDEAVKYGIQVRNFHKSIKGDMPNGRKYHAINAETFYWAHVTFFEGILRASDLGVLERPLTCAEREQIFEESKEWFSMFGVDDRAQPQTYDEFEKYLDNVLRNELTDSKLAQYTVGLARRGADPSKLIPPKARSAAKVIRPALSGFLRMITVGPLEKNLRDELKLDFSRAEEVRFRLYVHFLRLTRIALRRSGAPLKYRLTPAAAAAFEREGLRPEDITLESAREALAIARACRVDAAVGPLGESPMRVEVAPVGEACRKCQRELTECAECGGVGAVGAEICDVCSGAQRGCPVHHADWASAH